MPVPPPHNGKTSAHATPCKLNARVRNAASLPGHAALRCLVSLQTNSCQGDPLRLAGWAFLQMAYLSEPPWAERMGLSWRSCPGSRYSGGISPTTSTQHTHARLDRGGRRRLYKSLSLLTGRHLAVNMHGAYTNTNCQLHFCIVIAVRKHSMLMAVSSLAVLAPPCARIRFRKTL